MGMGILLTGIANTSWAVSHTNSWHPRLLITADVAYASVYARPIVIQLHRRSVSVT